MSSHPNRDEKRLQELLAGKVIGDLSNEESQEFGELFSTIHAKDLQELELAAAALQIALSEEAKSEMPDSLRQKIADGASHYVLPPSERAASAMSVDESRHVQNTGISEPRVLQQLSRGRMAWRETLAWVALAASLLLAAQLWLNSSSKQQTTAQKLSAAEQRLALLNDSAKTMRIDWTSGKTPFDQAVTGDVVWNNESQQGFMRFVGMPPNKPTQEQYQLWIIDPDRDAEPVDGGVFDIVSSGEVIVPIQAKLKVIKPTVFAITIEKPGGVVVSTQERLPLVAQVQN